MTREECIDEYGNREINSTSVELATSRTIIVTSLSYSGVCPFVQFGKISRVASPRTCAHDCDLATLSKINVWLKFGLFRLAKQSSHQEDLWARSEASIGLNYVSTYTIFLLKLRFKRNILIARITTNVWHLPQ